ncbi:endonuclease/exonuclease/phosphatase family protein [Microbispora sp. RL4-1S]|uniref:Endonuclease/exonuclease/phosphatase family protein n=1 Tax=Microbispora oryzae TaxID=2806554 RepID=A0A940WBU0_9ACTN|nr:endonuclease/exonuclease/phosphatase family protein [Microbispora oryzae]MBP2702586.1 endonuclease/exonuclease/phosphatase family protein [Microbispora oryzae]
MTALVWTLTAPFLLWAVLRLLPSDVHFRWVQLVAFTPWVAAASPLGPLAALLTRRWRAFVIGVAATTALAACVVPRALPEGQPDTRGPALRVLSANLLLGSVPPRALLALVRDVRPDVVTLQEFTPALARGLREAGIAGLLPYGVERPVEGSGGSAVLSRYPVRLDATIEFGGFRQTGAVVRVPGAGDVHVVSVHPCAPRYPVRLRCWTDGLAALPRPDGDTRILSGDFNATLDHAGLRALLNAGYRDAADATGGGLAGTWPYQRWRFLGLDVPPVTIDHVLASPGVAVRSFAVRALSLSDHRAIVADLTLPARRAQVTVGASGRGAVAEDVPVPLG